MSEKKGVNQTPEVSEAFKKAVQDLNLSSKISQQFAEFDRSSKVFFDDQMKQMERIQDYEAKKIAEEYEYKQSVLSALQGIEKNTAILTEMSMLLKENKDKQEEIFEIMVEILAIMKSSNEEEAKSRFTTVMEKITAFKDGSETLISLYGMAQQVYTVYQSLS
ncbi:hypothetical protein [Metabacillus sp. FJAT-52054]|uniref:DUF1641 domain-containing protein n=1 Tax=Metabacillus sediminis TaxID=3117746 RepID=A0ABZ2NMY1_9BACI